jgi:hypothetical protein
MAWQLRARPNWPTCRLSPAGRPSTFQNPPLQQAEPQRRLLARSIKSSTPTPSRAPSLPMDRAHAQRRRGSHARFPFQRETRRQKRREAVDRGPTKPPPPGPACHALACTPSLGERAVGKGQIPSVTPAASVAPCGVPPCVHPKRPPRTLADLTLLRTTRGTHWQRQ